VYVVNAYVGCRWESIREGTSTSEDFIIFKEFAERLSYQMIFNIYLEDNAHVATRSCRSESFSTAPSTPHNPVLSLLQLNQNAMKSRLSNPSEKVKIGASTPTAIKTSITIAKLVQLMVKFMLFAVLSLFQSVLTTTLLKCKIEAIFSGFLTKFLEKVQ